MGVISIIAIVLAVIFGITFTYLCALPSKSNKKGIKALVISVICLLIAFFFKTGNTEYASRLILGLPALLMIVVGFIVLIIQEYKIAIKIIAVSVVMFLTTALFGMNFSSSKPGSGLCDWCEKRPAQYNSRFCSQCDDKLF